MCPITIFVFSAQDTQEDDFQRIRAHQEALMQIFFSNTGDAILEQISRGEEDSPICGSPESLPWIGLTLRDQLLERVNYRALSLYPWTFQLEYLPPSVRFINIEECTLERPFLETRALPRRAENINLQTNMICGSLCLHTLPRDLTYLNVADNRICSIHSLTNLPRGLERLKLGYNIIKQKVLFYDELPPRIIRIELEEAKIGLIEAIVPSDRIKNPKNYFSTGDDVKFK